MPPSLLTNQYLTKSLGFRKPSLAHCECSPASSQRACSSKSSLHCQNLSTITTTCSLHQRNDLPARSCSNAITNTRHGTASYRQHYKSKTRSNLNHISWFYSKTNHRDLVVQALTISSMLYYTTIVHLFRPMLKVDLIGSDVHPRDICIEAANKVSNIVRIYRCFYDFRVAHLIIPHCLLSVSIVHLLYSKDDRTSYMNLVDGLHGLQDVQMCHYFGARSFRIIHTLAKTWKLPWPEEFRQSKLISENDSDMSQSTRSPPADPLLIVPNTVTTTGNRLGPNMPYSPVAQPNRRESLSMFGPQGSLQIATHSAAVTRPGSVQPVQHLQSPVVGRTSTQSYPILSPYQQYSQSMSSVPNQSSTKITSPTTDAAETLFWNPIPGMPGPILPRNNYTQLSPMGLDSVLQSSDMGDRLGRDGFKISEDWQSSHVNGFPSSNNNGFNAQVSQPGSAYRRSAGFAQQGNGVGGYQQGQQHHAQQGHGQPEEFDGGWYSGQMS